MTEIEKLKAKIRSLEHLRELKLPLKPFEKAAIKSFEDDLAILEKKNSRK